jgi:hypothetical protein
VIFALTILCLLFLFGITAGAYEVESPAQVEDYIHFKAQKEGLNVKLVLAIAKAESGLKINAKNPSSSASGVFQFINGTFRGYCIEKYKFAESMEQKNDPLIQIRCATEMLLEPKGYKHWWASSASWKHLL